VKVQAKDQCLRHAQYGIGIVKSSDSSKTVIDFYEHGTKTFVTGMLEAELVSEAPPRPKKPKVKKATSGDE
jgi:hypothetical protein